MARVRSVVAGCHGVDRKRRRREDWKVCCASRFLSSPASSCILTVRSFGRVRGGDLNGIEHRSKEPECESGKRLDLSGIAGCACDHLQWGSSIQLVAGINPSTWKILCFRTGFHPP
eukprot:6462066-Prymnesium_polylepis.1